jgi:N-carbamoylputrescine amidase
MGLSAITWEAGMPEIVRAALVQQAWTGDKDSMIAVALRHIHAAADQGAQVVCLQELFYGPYFCQVQDADYYSYTEAIPDGPTTRLLQRAAETHRIVIVAPMYEEEQPGLYYNTAAVIDADGSYLGKYRKNHLPQVKGFWEKFYFRPGNLGYPVFDTAVGRIGVYICYDRHFPEGWRALGLAGAKIVFNPSATSRGLSAYLWQLEQPAAAVANEYFIGAINRVGVESLGDNDFYGGSYFVDPRGQLVGEAASDNADEAIVRDLDMGKLVEVRDLWQFYRDRRPDSYDGLVKP